MTYTGGTSVKPKPLEHILVSFLRFVATGVMQSAPSDMAGLDSWILSYYRKPKLHQSMHSRHVDLERAHKV